VGTEIRQAIAVQTGIADTQHRWQIVSRNQELCSDSLPLLNAISWGWGSQVHMSKNLLIAIRYVALKGKIEKYEEEVSNPPKSCGCFAFFKGENILPIPALCPN